MGANRVNGGPSPVEADYDLVVAGSGAGGLAAAVTAAVNGLRVLVIEKEAFIGGTTARSGGVLWLPCNPVLKAAGIDDSLEEARRYLEGQTGPHFDASRVDAFLENCAAMVEFFERRTEVRFVPLPGFADYHPNADGASLQGRAILAAPYHARHLGREIRRLRPPLRVLTFVGMMFNASQEVAHFFNCTRSVRSAAYVARRLVEHAGEMLRYGRPQRITNGNALVARLFRSALDAGVDIRTEAALEEIVREDGQTHSVRVRRNGTIETVRTKRIVLATGGFPQSTELRRRNFRHAPTGAEHWSPAPPGNTGDGWQIAERIGAETCAELPNNGAWIPVSLVPRRQGAPDVFPHLIDRYKPGIIAVNPKGERFVNEADSYHDFGEAMQRHCATDGMAPQAWLICDHRAIRRYGLGFAKPFPLPLWPHLRSGYLLRADSLDALARKAGIAPESLVRTVEAYNLHAGQGEDPAFGKGSTAYNRYLGDATHRPNHCVAPLARGPYYALRLVMGDLGTFAGIRTDARARVMDRQGAPLPGVYAVGNDALSIMGGNYPGAGITLGPAMTFGYIAGLDIAGAVAADRPAADAGPDAATGSHEAA
ncbi:FAD-dependent oxidoreductase [Oceanibacterium hippocampi]|uniref:3-oxosteroid 1-dehydrogenase n=1 Tax=Oceanibacterium hippocampi TaxID=745714 RepID=A0A1Y5TKY8_9PROT|nr:FAD-dependent oxidoreductase [Oceanibacterium hippocampi]SLN66436.1 3-oxosteroid 1-dehydrogenase [Oceanibacterium hippocampi]